MGTRGTLRVYVDGVLKIRQYNQWDSYPTGQFADICEFMGDGCRVVTLYDKLKHTAFFTADEIDEITNNEWWNDDSGGPYHASDYYFMTHRDWGARILDLIILMPSRFYEGQTAEGETINLKLADWADVYGVQDLEPEEGNYDIEINKHEDGGLGILIGGEYHGVKRVWNYIPSDNEVKAWQIEADGE